MWNVTNIEYTNPETNLFFIAYIIENKVNKIKIEDGNFITLDEEGNEVDEQSFHIKNDRFVFDDKEYSYSLLDNNLSINFNDVELLLTKK